MSLPAITFLLYVIARPSQGGRGNLSVPIRTYDYAEIAEPAPSASEESPFSLHSSQ